MLKIFSKIKNVFTMWSWCCAIRFNDDSDTCILNDKQKEFKIVPNSRRYWLADPFLFKKDGILYLFFEAFDLLKCKGVIGYRTVSDDGFGKIQICYESKTHLSFPFIYTDGDNIFIIPESAKENRLYKLKCVDFPGNWEECATLYNDKLVDTVRTVIGGKELFLTEKVEKDNVFDRLDLYYKNDNKFIPCKANPVKRDSSNARNAGNVFMHGNMLIRPSQNCSSSYGEKLNFNKIVDISENNYEEELLECLSYNDVKINKPVRVDGIHTYNKLENVEVIDLRIPGKFNLLYFFGMLRKAFKKLFSR